MTKMSPVGTFVLTCQRRTSGGGCEDQGAVDRCDPTPRPTRMRHAIAILALLIASASIAAEIRSGARGSGEAGGKSALRYRQSAGAKRHELSDRANERAQNVLSLAPILPFRLTSWLVVNNTISIPLVWSPDITNRTDSTFGMGDITLSSPFTVTFKEIFFVALGPIFAFPTATDSRLGSYDSGKFSIGPEATIEVTPHHWVLGLSVGNIWSVAGRDSGSTVNAFNLAPAITFNLPSGYYLTTSSSIGAAWTVPSDDRWAVSWGGGVGAVKLFTRTVGISYEVQAFWDIVRPDPAPLWQLRFQASLFFPKLRSKPQ